MELVVKKKARVLLYTCWKHKAAEKELVDSVTFTEEIL